MSFQISESFVISLLLVHTGVLIHVANARIYDGPQTPDVPMRRHRYGPVGTRKTFVVASQEESRANECERTNSDNR